MDVKLEPIQRPFPRYERAGECARCGSCCLGENCEYLLVGDEGAICAIHDDPSRPEKCKTYPDNPPLVFEKCGYHFRDLWEDGKIVRRKL